VQPTFRNTWPSWVALVLGFTCAAAFFASLGLLVLGVPVTNSPGFAALNPGHDLCRLFPRKRESRAKSDSERTKPVSLR
jgi:hypothetical protein